MRKKMVVRPSVETVVSIHSELINKTGGLNGIRDTNLLDMSVNSPFQTFDGDLYETLVDKASHLAFSLIKNHPFIDGNKRIGVTTMVVFLESNDVEISCSNEELVKLGLGVANGSFCEYDIRDWIHSHIINI
jgi:death-on-curing protein